MSYTLQIEMCVFYARNINLAQSQMPTRQSLSLGLEQSPTLLSMKEGRQDLRV